MTTFRAEQNTQQLVGLFEMCTACFKGQEKKKRRKTSWLAKTASKQLVQSTVGKETARKAAHNRRSFGSYQENAKVKTLPHICSPIKFCSQ